MNKDLQKRLSKYTAAVAALVSATGATAQIVYTDVDPDYSHPGNEGAIGLDMDNDDNPDFIIASMDSIYATPNGPVRIRATFTAPYGINALLNAIAGEDPGGYNYALALDAGAMIDNTLNWIATTNTMAYNVDSANPYAENWNGVTDKYLGLQFVTAGSTYFGWARMDVQAIGDTWTLKDYAYNSTANAAIAAGQIVDDASVNTMDLESLLHFVNQSNNTVKVVINGGLTEGVITLVSSTGQTVSTGKVDSNEYIVDLNGLSAGIYIISAEFAEGRMTKKVIVH